MATFTPDSGHVLLRGNTPEVHAAWTLAADHGSFALAGQAVLLEHWHRLTAAVGTFALSGQDAGLRRDYRLSADVGSFSLSGQAAGFVLGFKLAAELGTFTLAGQAATLARGNGLPAVVGSFVFTGQSATLRRGYKLAAECGTFTLNGQDAHRQLGNWSPQAYVLTADVGIFSLRGYPVVTPASFTQAGGATKPNRRRVKPQPFEYVASGGLVFSGSAHVQAESISLRRIYGGLGNLGIQACALVEAQAERITYVYLSRLCDGNRGNGVRIPGGSAVSSYLPGLCAYSARAGPMSRTLSRWGGSAVCELQTRQRRSA